MGQPKSFIPDSQRSKSMLRTMYDGLKNVVTGMGTAKSKREHDTWVLDLMNGWQQLDAAYQSNWIARQIVDGPAKDMTREWRRIKTDSAEDIAAHEDELCVDAHVQEAISWSRLYGGSGILMCTGQDLGQPLNLSKIKKGSLEKLIVFDRHELSAHDVNMNDILADNYLEAEYYTIEGGAQRIHHSHVVRFMGEQLPRRQRKMTQGWGGSVLRKCIEEVNDMVAAKGGVAELMREANIDVIKRDGLSEELASDQDDAIIDRYSTFSMMKSVVNMALLDENETLERQTLNLSGVAPIIEQFMTWISGAARQPVTKIFGTSAKGMNATGEGDKDNYYDDIRSDQKLLRIPMRKLDEVLVRSATGSFPADFDYVWNPLEQPDVVEQEQAALLRSQKHAILLETNIIQRSQVQRELQANEEYQFDEDKLNELEELEDDNMFEGLPGVEPEAEEVETVEPVVE